MAQETAPNKPLTGRELRDLIVKDMAAVLDQDTMLASHVAYKNVAYSITVKVMLNNPIIPDWKNRVKSKDATDQQIAENESMGAVKAFPLSRTEDDETADFGIERTRHIISPNTSRIENDMPVPITRRTVDGNTEEVGVHYEKDSLPEDGYPDNVTDRALADDEISKGD